MSCSILEYEARFCLNAHLNSFLKELGITLSQVNEDIHFNLIYHLG